MAVRHMFAGGNTPDGFFSYYDNILLAAESRRTIYIKGGSGTGKSTFMKKAGIHFEEKEYDVEYFHCSNDKDSLDGVCIPKLKIAIIDATSPHMQDPVIPMAADEIMDAAKCLNREGLRPHAKELLEILADKKELIKMAYGYLHAAYAVYMNNAAIYERFLDKPALNKIIHDVLNKTFLSGTPADKEGRHRKLFASAVTPDGFVSYMDMFLGYKNITVINAAEGLGGSLLLAKLKEAAQIKGYYTEGFYSPLSPYSLEHLIIPEQECCFVTKNRYHDIKADAALEIDLYELLNRKRLIDYEDKLQYNHVYFDELAGKAMQCLKESGMLHGRVEEIYIANMDFTKLDDMYEDLMTELDILI